MKKTIETIDGEEFSHLLQNCEDGNDDEFDSSGCIDVHIQY